MPDAGPGRLGPSSGSCSSPTPTEGESYPLSDDHVDLEPLARDAVLLELPLAPLCRRTAGASAPRAGPTATRPVRVRLRGRDPLGGARRPRDDPPRSN